MVKLEIGFDETKLKQLNEYNINDIFDYIDEMFRNVNITKSEKSENGKIYFGNDNNQDMAKFFCGIFHLEEQEWFIKYAKEMILFDNTETPQKDIFKAEDILSQIHNKLRKH